MDKSTVLAGSTLFSSLPADALQSLGERFEFEELHGGDILFREGDSPDYLYIVVSGRLRARHADGSVAGDIGRHEPVGEMALLSGETRSADVYALRDSLLLRIGRQDLLDVTSHYPAALLELCRTIVLRMKRNRHRSMLDSVRRSRTMAVVSAVRGIDPLDVAQRLAGSMRADAPSSCIGAADIDAALGEGVSQTPFGANEKHRELATWLEEREAGDQNLIYWTHANGGAWLERCLRQSDRVVIAVDSSSDPLAGPLVNTLRRLRIQVPISLLVLRPDGAAPGDVLYWRERFGADAHYFVRPSVESDYASVARQLTGRGLGLVFGGGGARGFAHIGLVRAMEELNMRADLIGGTSMGAFFAGLYAAGADSKEMLKVGRATYIEKNYLNDFTWPRVSFIRGVRFLNRLNEVFGSQLIENLRMPYFAVSTNLTRARHEVHDTGSLATWVGTSMCVPGVGPPIAWNGCLLVDGAVTNSLPIDVMHDLGRGPIIASDVSSTSGLDAPGIVGPDPVALLNKRTNVSAVSLFGLLSGGLAISSDAGVRAREELADLYLRMPIAGVGMFGWKDVDAMIDRSYVYCLEALSGFQQP